MFRQFLGIPAARRAEPGDPPVNAGRTLRRGAEVNPAVAAAESESVRRLVRHLEAVEPAQARFLACYAYTLARAANADFEISDAETRLIEELVTELGAIAAHEAAFVVELAKAQAGDIGGTDDFLVTREFMGVSTRAQQIALVRSCLAIAAVDGSISAEESAVANQIANELGLTSVEMAPLRAEFSDRMASIQEIRRRLASAAG